MDRLGAVSKLQAVLLNYPYLLLPPAVNWHDLHRGLPAYNTVMLRWGCTLMISLSISVLEIHIIHTFLTHTPHVCVWYSCPGGIPASIFIIQDRRMNQGDGATWMQYQIQMWCQKEVDNKNSHGINNNCLVHTSDGNTLKCVQPRYQKLC